MLGSRTDPWHRLRQILGSKILFQLRPMERCSDEASGRRDYQTGETVIVRLSTSATLIVTSPKRTPRTSSSDETTSILHHADVRRVDRLHPHHMITGVDVQHLASRPGAQTGQQVGRRAAH